MNKHLPRRRMAEPDAPQMWIIRWQDGVNEL